MHTSAYASALVVARVATLLLVASCDTDRAATSERPESASSSIAPDTSSAQSASLGAHRAEDLVTAATQIVGFLRGQVPFDAIRLADTVTLQLSREGGGTPRRLPREVLRNPSSWRVRSSDLPNARGMMYSFRPHRDLTVLTTRVGRHLKCMEFDLSSVAPELATLPHVGTMLKPIDYGSCLQTWNLTLVFDSAAKPPTLVAAVYDQFEW